MSKIRITKKFTFEMAHALWNYDGACKNIHGHSYQLYVTVIGKPITDKKHKKYGMIIDFSDLKSIIDKEIIDKFDHATVLNKDIPDNFAIQYINKIFGKILYVDYQPTCENLVIDIVNRIKNKLPDNISLQKIKLYETASSFAEWVITDNEKY